MSPARNPRVDFVQQMREMVHFGTLKVDGDAKIVTQ